MADAAFTILKLYVDVYVLPLKQAPFAPMSVSSSELTQLNPTLKKISLHSRLVSGLISNHKRMILKFQCQY